MRCRTVLRITQPFKFFSRGRAGSDTPSAPRGAIGNARRPSVGRHALRSRLRDRDGVDPDRVIFSPDAARAAGLTSRFVFPANRDHGPPQHSVGHWEGDTLVVETGGFNELGRLGVLSGGLRQNLPRTEKLRVTERFRRPDLGHLEVETTYEEPGAYKKPFKTRYVKSLAPKDWETLEYVCNENEKDAAHRHFYCGNLLAAAFARYRRNTRCELPS